MNTSNISGLRRCVGVTVVILFTLLPQTMENANSSPAKVAANAQVAQIAAANTQFGFNLLHQLNDDSKNDNVFFSPFSVTQALSLTLNGAGDPTDKEISHALGLRSLTLDEVNHGNALLLPSITNPDPKVQLSVANALWANKGEKFSSAFQGRCDKYYKATVATLDFQSPSGANTINNWVKNKTHDKIDKIVSQEDIEGSPAVLTNALYFHGQWTKQFEKRRTQDGPFNLADGTSKTVPFMSRSGTFAYSETPTFQAVSLPYGSGRLSMYIVLPKAGTTIGDVVDKLDSNTWQDDITQMHPTEVGIALPRFKASYSTLMNDQLSALGMGPAFGSGANFTPMGLPGVFIGKVIHKAVLDVNEEGTVAAAATAVIMTRSIRLTPQMRVDHPFFCAIRDNETGTILFMGVIRDPQ